jgi:hypothetical protein
LVYVGDLTLNRHKVTLDLLDDETLKLGEPSLEPLSSSVISDVVRFLFRFSPVPRKPIGLKLDDVVPADEPRTRRRWDLG